MGNFYVKNGDKKILRIHSIQIGDERIPIFPANTFHGATKSVAVNYLIDRKGYSEKELVEDDLLAYQIFTGSTQFLAVGRLTLDVQTMLRQNPFWTTYGLALGRGSPRRKFVVADGHPVARNFEGTRLAEDVENYNYVRERMRDLIDLEEPRFYPSKWIESVIHVRHAVNLPVEDEVIMEKYKELKDLGLLSEDAKNPIRPIPIEEEYCVNLAPIISPLTQNTYTYEEIGAMLSGIINMKRMGKSNLVYTVVLYAELDCDSEEVDVKVVNHNFSEYKMNENTQKFLEAYNKWLDENNPFDMAKKISELIKNAAK